MRGAGGEKSQKHHEGQLWPTDPKLPSSQKKAVSSVTKLLLHGRAPSSVPQTPQLEFASLSQQMTCRWTAHLAASPPPLSKREREKKKIRKEKRRKMTSQGCVSFGRLASEASTAPDPVKGSLRLRARGDPHYRIQGSLQDRGLLCQLGVLTFCCEAHWSCPASEAAVGLRTRVLPWFRQQRAGPLEQPACLQKKGWGVGSKLALPWKQPCLMDISPTAPPSGQRVG